MARRNDRGERRVDLLRRLAQERDLEALAARALPVGRVTIPIMSGTIMRRVLTRERDRRLEHFGRKHRRRHEREHANGAARRKDRRCGAHERQPFRRGW